MYYSILDIKELNYKDALSQLRLSNLPQGETINI